MNYRHAFHAGGFADVLKHIVLARILLYLQEKQAAFCVIDTHAGAGIYDLAGEEAQRGGEWLTGIARIMQARFSQTTASLMKPYLDVVRAFNPPGAEFSTYPGSPLIALAPAVLSDSRQPELVVATASATNRPAATAHTDTMDARFITPLAGT